MKGKKQQLRAVDEEKKKGKKEKERSRVRSGKWAHPAH
jgi:hypothetical protein